MKNHRELLGIAVNVVLVVVLLIFIVVGLNKIGIYDLPDWAEKIIGTYDNPDDDGLNNRADTEKSIEYSADKNAVEHASELTYENARELIEAVLPVSAYKHEMTVEYLSGGEKVSSEIVSLICSDGLYRASVSDIDGNPKKYVSENADSTVVTVFEGGESAELVYPKTTFDISDECGFIIKADNFLESDYELDEATFYLENGSYGAELTITFDTVLGEYTQTEVYTLSLDYGVVVFAECFENENLVYSMSTKSLSRD